MNALFLMIVPMLVALGFFILGGRKVSFGEFVLHNVGQLIFILLFLGISSCSNTTDFEVLSGRVTKKERIKTSCHHSYQCNCYTTCSSNGKSTSCSTHCQTCYEHSYDIAWPVYSSINTFYINTIDRQGLKEPPRWTATKIGEPVSVTRSFTNYIKASPDSLFRRQGLVEKYKDTIPNYPGEIYDYWHINRLVNLGVSVQDAMQWNKDLHEMNADVGPTKKANVSVVLVSNKPADWFFALEQAWIGGKKNDFIVVISVDENKKIQWANVIAWTNNKMAEVVVSDEINKLGVLDKDQINFIIKSNVEKYFDKKSMEDFKYLESAVTLSGWQWFFGFILSLIISVGLGIIVFGNNYEQGDGI